MRKYRSEAYEALHEDILGNFEVGAISEAELKEFEERCFIEKNPRQHSTSAMITEHKSA